MPHIKTYTRYLAGGGVTRLAWLLLTSANVSKAAWGQVVNTHTNNKKRMRQGIVRQTQEELRDMRVRASKGKNRERAEGERG